MPGAGASGVVQMRNVAVGNARLMEEVGVDVGALEREAGRLRVLGQTIVFVAVDRMPIGLLGIADPLKPDSWDAVQEFKREGLRIVLLSGDHADSVRSVAQQLGIHEVHAGVMPDEKAAVIRALRLSGATMSNVRQNLLFAFGYNSLGVPIAAGILYPLTGLLLAPAVAAAAMSLSSVSVIANALRLRKVKI